MGEPEPRRWPGGPAGDRGRRLSLLALVLITVGMPGPDARALRCVPPAPLLPLPPGQTVVLGEILRRHTDGSLDIRVLEVMQGSLPQRSPSPRGRLRLDSRSLSYWSFGRLPFPQRSRWIFQLLTADPANRDFDAALSPCIEPPQVVNGMVRGWLLPSPGPEPQQSMALQELRRRIRAASPTPGAPPGRSDG